MPNYRFDDELPTRKFDNFQFVGFEKEMAAATGDPLLGFAVKALMEVPEQFAAIRALGYL